MLKHYVPHDNQGITDKPVSAVQEPVTPVKPNPPDPAPIEQKPASGSITLTGINASLQWLARHQSPDGHWDSDGFTGMCEGAPCKGAGMPEYDIGLTGLSLLAFLDRGYTHLSRETYYGIRYGEIVKKGLRWIITRQKDDGHIGQDDPILNHCLAALALSEAYCMTESQLFKGPAQKSIDYIVNSQETSGGWHNIRKNNADDAIFITCWAIMALKTAQLGNLKVPDSTMETALKWVETNSGTSPEDTAIAMWCKLAVRHDRDEPFLTDGAKLLAVNLPAYHETTEKNASNNYFYWFIGGMALVYYDDPDLKACWENACAKAVLSAYNTNKNSCLFGSCDSTIDKWGRQGGMVYATALNVLASMCTYTDYLWPASTDGK